MFKIKRKQNRFAKKRNFFQGLFLKKQKKQLFHNNKTSKKIVFLSSKVSNFWKRFFIQLSYFLVVVLFIGLIFIFFFTSLFVVKNINLERENFRIDSGEVLDFLSEYRYRNILLISTSKIEEDIKKKFPEYKTATVKRILPNSLSVQVKNFEIIAKLKVLIKPEKRLVGTGSSLVETLGLQPYEQILALNSIGIIEAYNELYQDFPMLEIANIQDFPLVQGDKLLSLDKLSLILKAKEELFNELKLSVNYMKYFPDARELHLKTNNEYEIWIDFMSPITEQIDKLKKISNDVDWNENPPNEYIDLRVKNRIIYK